jgi:cell division protein FtsW
MNKDLAKVDNPLFVAAMALTLGGLIMIYSGSSVLAYQNYGDGSYFFKRQLLWLIIALVLGVAAFKLPLDMVREHINKFLIAAIVLLFAVHLPGLGHRVAGGLRWIRIGPFSFQPFEAAKLAYVIYLAKVFAAEKAAMKAKIARVCFITALIGGALIWQRDLGGAAIIMAVFLCMLLVAGVDLRYFLVFVPVIVLGVIYFIKVEPYRIIRILAYLNPWKDPLGAGWQTTQSLIAIGSGGPLGVGIFESQQKYNYLPTPHTDYIFAIIGEELGLWGGLLVLVGFFFILQRGTYVALHTNDLFPKYLAAGLTLMIILQALANICVATGIMPPKGTTLPFLSFGGTSLMVNIMAVGILLSISRRLPGSRA